MICTRDIERSEMDLQYVCVGLRNDVGLGHGPDF